MARALCTCSTDGQTDCNTRAAAQHQQRRLEFVRYMAQQRGQTAERVIRPDGIDRSMHDDSLDAFRARYEQRAAARMED